MSTRRPTGDSAKGTRRAYSLASAKDFTKVYTLNVCLVFFTLFLCVGFSKCLESLEFTLLSCFCIFYGLFERFEMSTEILFALEKNGTNNKSRESMISIIYKMLCDIVHGLFSTALLCLGLKNVFQLREMI